MGSLSICFQGLLCQAVFMAQVRRTGQWSPSCATSLRTQAGQPLSWAYFSGVQEWGLSMVAPEIKDSMA